MSEMCDYPNTAVFLTDDRHRSWIIFKEMKTEKGSTRTMQAGIQTTDHYSKTDQNLDNVHLLLDEHLRPGTPDFSDCRSIALFEEHKKLAKEYLMVQTEYVLQKQKRDKLLAAQSQDTQKRRQTIEQLQREKEALLLLRENLKDQKDAITAKNNRQRSSSNSSDWVLLSDKEN